MNEIPTRLAAALTDRYRLLEELGAGGMATVYLADDLKHERKVAVKVLRPELAAVIGGERFIAEIKTTAQLQHPHILPLFDSGEVDSFLYYVMPFVEGESLRTRLDRERQLDVDEALHIARAVASALQYAHERDVIHRDIKPENILLHAGEPVVADFGIALAISAAGGGRLTETGLSLGTPHYMSPEQASADRDLSARSDVYSLACVLYEMLAGQPPHTGPTAQSILVRILTEEPRHLEELRPTVPRHVRSVVEKGLEKLPADRFRSAADFRAALDDPSFTHERAAVTAAGMRTRLHEPAATPTAPGLGRRAAIGLGVPLAAAALGLGWLLGRSGGRDVPGEVPVLSFVVRDSTSIRQPAVGPDGTLAYAERGVLYARPAGSTEERVLVDETPEGFVGGGSISPDGRWIVFALDGRGRGALRKMPVGGGSQATLYSWGESDSYGAPMWADDGSIYLSSFRANGAELVRVPEEGGEPEVLLSSADAWPKASALLPGGRALLFTPIPRSGSGPGGVVLLDLESGDTATVVDDGFDGRWSPTGHIVYGHESGALWALPFDPKARRATGAAAPVLDRVAVDAPFDARFALGANGVLLYTRGAAASTGENQIRFAFVDRDGDREELPLEPTDHWDARLSPDGTELAYTRRNDIWIYDLDLGTNRPLTTGGTGEHNPVWSPDGVRIAYLYGDSVYTRSVSSGGDARAIGAWPGGADPSDWPEEGTLVAYGQSKADIMAFSTDGSGEARPLLQADWAERRPRVSPERRWIAYLSSRSGTFQTYVRSWPDLRSEVQVSDGEGTFGFPIWSADGRSLFYVQGGRVWEATLGLRDGEGVVGREDTGVVLGEAQLVDLAPDGRFLVWSGSDAGADSDVRELVVVTNWLQVIRDRLGGGTP